MRDEVVRVRVMGVGSSGPLRRMRDEVISHVPPSRAPAVHTERAAKRMERSSAHLAFVRVRLRFAGEVEGEGESGRVRVEG